jgi:hypothetical protein
MVPAMGGWPRSILLAIGEIAACARGVVQDDGPWVASDTGVATKDGGNDVAPLGDAAVFGSQNVPDGGGAPPPSPTDANAADTNDTDGFGEGAADAHNAPDVLITVATAPVVRAYKDSTGEHFYTLSATEALNAGFMLEDNPYYFAAATSGPQAQFIAFHRCLLPSGFHFDTTAPNCENSGGVHESDLGFVATTSTCGAIPLYRLLGPYGDHLYTVSAAEKASAQAKNAYTYEGICGYVWTQATIVCP